MPYFFDFRGRLYSYTDINPINNKLSRGLVNLNSAASADWCAALKTNTNCRERVILKQYAKLLNLSLAGGRSEVLFKLFVILIEIAKTEKTQLIKDSGASPKDFMKLGFDTLTKFRANDYVTPDIEAHAYIIKLNYELDFFYKNGVWRNFTINKDATASAFQH